MTTPIFDFINNYIDSNPVRAHMPGHKGLSGDDIISKLNPYDITEIKGADSLFDAEGIILESEKNTASLYGSAKTVFSTSGSTLCVQTMLALTCKEGDTVIAARNSHRSFIHACVLLGLKIKWVYPIYGSGTMLSGTFTPEAIEDAIISSSSNKKPACVFITSPDYLGKISDIKSISEVCKKYDIPLLVDNAHGAYLKFLEESIHPIDLGADICCDSAHKTLPALTGGAYLHIKNPKFIDRVKEDMALFASSSPSYLILQSLDLCNKYLDSDFRIDLDDACHMVNILKDRLSDMYSICTSEPLKLVIYTLPCGLHGYQLAEILQRSNIHVEYSDSTHLMMMFSVKNTKKDMDRIYEALSKVKMPKVMIYPPDVNFPALETVMTAREAFFAESEEIDVDDCEGRICAKTRTLCPPCIPVAVSGERFSKECINILKMYSIFKVNVVK